jgi:sulfur-carrier protein
MARLVLFAAAREAAGTGTATVDGRSVAEVLDSATERFGPDFSRILAHCSVFVDDERVPTSEWGGREIAAGTEVAVLPPTSGGA